MRELTGWLGNNWPTNRGALPDFLIIRAQKAGTTHLYNSLLNHPLIGGALTEEGVLAKEVRFFSVQKGVGGKKGIPAVFPRAKKLAKGHISAR